MTDIPFSKDEIEEALRNLRRNQSELSHIDGKETLNLKNDGDCALFIRHACALANTGQRAYFIIGVENKTWKSIGIPENSPLADVDVTQQQMNQILANRVDPPLEVSYRTVRHDKVLIGAARVAGGKPPYIISITDSRYGGPKTQGNASYVYRGAIYVRRGTDSVIANRQSEILDVLEGRIDIVDIVISLVFIGTLVGSGVGIGASVWEFGDAYAAAFLGGVWGLAIGWIFHRRVAETLGRTSIGLLGRIAKSGFGPIWGGSIGTLMSYILVDGILRGTVKASHPAAMALIMGPLLAVLIMLMVVGLAFNMHMGLDAARSLINRIKRNT